MKRTRFARIYEKSIGKIIPEYGFLSVLFCFVFNSLIYTGIQLLMGKARHFDLTTALDNAIPFLPGWSVVYLGCFLFWGINYILITRQKKEDWFRFATADYLSRIVCGIFFILLPTTNVRPEVVGEGIGQSLIRFVYSMDAPTNLFPSIHCLVSWMCFIGIRGKEYVPKWYRIFSCLFAAAVFASTLFTKQHYIIDVFAGVIIAEVCYYISNHGSYYQWVMKKFDRINTRVFGEEMNEKEKYGV
ncbi:MAG: phosphatase PAP2 family protein [Clostridiaceae bacterium]|nr:phosphatase PAP2 family protein [Clostridiaceae bacterium]